MRTRLITSCSYRRYVSCWRNPDLAACPLGFRSSGATPTWRMGGCASWDGPGHDDRPQTEIPLSIAPALPDDPGTIEGPPIHGIHGLKTAPSISSHQRCRQIVRRFSSASKIRASIGPDLRFATRSYDDRMCPRSSHPHSGVPSRVVMPAPPLPAFCAQVAALESRTM